jgi:hypothetical protein
MIHGQPHIRSVYYYSTGLLASMDALPINRTWQPPCSHSTYQHEVITSRSRQLLMMRTWLPETCWATIRREIKNTKSDLYLVFLIHTELWCTVNHTSDQYIITLRACWHWTQRDDCNTTACREWELLVPSSPPTIRLLSVVWVYFACRVVTFLTATDCFLQTGEMYEARTLCEWDIRHTELQSRAQRQDNWNPLWNKTMWSCFRSIIVRLPWVRWVRIRPTGQILER